MPALPAIDPEQFVTAVRPLLAKKDLKGLVALLTTRWTATQISAMLRSGHDDARKVAAVSLSLVGTPRCVPELVKMLQDDCPCVNQVAEHALWSIWFRGGSPESNHQLARGAQAVERRDFEHALLHFGRAIECSPDFPEPYNQRAIAHFLMERYDRSLADCRRAVDLLPVHFGAWAGMGHGYAHLGKFDCAIRAYDKALEINPHLHAIREAVVELRSRLCHPCDDSSVHT